MPTLILASGSGLDSLLMWQSASECVPESLRLDAVFRARSPCGIDTKGSCPVSFRFQRSRSLWLSQALQTMNSAWRLTSWCVRRDHSEYLVMSGPGGVVVGAGSETRSTTDMEPSNF